MSSILKVDTIQDQSGNNIINENADTITIGASGDTVNIVGTLQNNGSAVGGGTQAFDAGTVSLPSITTTGDTNTGIFFPAADTIAFTEGGAEAMRIDSSGRVGIGTSAPNAELEIASSSTQIRLTDTDTNAYAEIGTDGSGILNFMADEGNTGATPRITFDVSTVERMRIDSAGDVGIGTNDPITKLHINTSSSGSNVNLLCLGNPNSADNTATSIVFAPTANDVTTRHARIQGTQKTNNSIELDFFTCQGSTPASRMKIIDDGSLILVGSTAQKASGTTWSNPSDTRLKDNKQNYTKGLTELLQINVKTWEWNGKAGTTQGDLGVGIVADEIETILPNTIDTYKAKLNENDTEETDVKRFDATEITWLLLNSIKEQQTIIEELKTTTTSQQNKIDALEARITTLENN